MKVVKKIKQEKFQCTCASDLEKKRENEKKVRDMEEKYNAQKTMLRKKDKEIREVIKVVKRKVGIFQLWPWPPSRAFHRKYATLDYPPSPRILLCSFYFDGFPQRSNHGD